MEEGVSIGVLVRIPDNNQDTTKITTTVTIKILAFVKTRPRYSPRERPRGFDLLISTASLNGGVFKLCRGFRISQLYDIP